LNCTILYKFHKEILKPDEWEPEQKSTIWGNNWNCTANKYNLLLMQISDTSTPVEMLLHPKMVGILESESIEEVGKKTEELNEIFKNMKVD